jgi:hypothetical protein
MNRGRYLNNACSFQYPERGWTGRPVGGPPNRRRRAGRWIARGEIYERDDRLNLVLVP